MRKIALAMVLVASAGGGVAAQDSPTPMQMMEEAKRQERATIQEQYEASRATREKLAPDGKADPWANMRGGEASAKKQPAKPQEKRAARKPPPPVPLTPR